MATYGRISAFDSSLESWSQYVERVELYFEANDVDASKKKAIFLTLVGPVVYKLVRSLIAPSTTETKSYAEIVKVLNDHYSPTPSEIVERFRFNSRMRKPGETVATFVSELRRLSEYCNFGNTMDTMIRDRLVCGIQQPEMQRRLLTEPGLTLAKAVDIAVSMETAARNSMDLQATNSFSSSVHKNFSHPKGGGNNSSRASVSYECYRCGATDHHPQSCIAKDKKCFSCGMMGHLAKKCLKSKKTPKKPKRPCNVVKAQHKSADAAEHSAVVDNVQPVAKEMAINGHRENVVHDIKSLSFQPEYDVFYNTGCVNKVQNIPKPYVCVFNVNNSELEFELDTGCAISLINIKTYKHLGSPALQPAETALSTFTGQKISVCGNFTCLVKYKNKTARLSLLVVEGGGPNLCGRNWIEIFNVLPFDCLHISDVSLYSILDEFKDVFKPELGHFKDFKVSLMVKPEVQPVFYKARTLPFAVRDRVKNELLRLQNSGIIKPVRYSQWAAPIVPVLKSDKTSIRICGDFKLTANLAIDADKYPLPKADDIFANLAGGVQFTKLDLKEAYNQLELDEESRKLTVINTHLPLFEYTRLAFGISSAPAFFQRVMETLLKGIPGTAVRFDDILVTGKNMSDHISNVREVLKRLQDSGLKLKKEKCKFMCDSLIFLGHKIDRDGISPVEDKIKAISEAPAPRNVSELRSFLGLITYYSKFLPNMSTRLAPLYNLLQNSVVWHWTDKENLAFVDAKNAICNTGLLVHFDPEKELILACDASPYGVGAVLSHTIDGQDRPIAFASRTLSPAEKNYSHLEKEALALVFGVTKFREYLLGRSFVLHTDHRPLVTLLSEKKPVPVMANSRIQRWAITLSAYSYTVRYRAGPKNGNADACSRLPLFTPIIDPPQPSELVLMMERVDAGPVSIADIGRATENDLMLKKIAKLILEGWPGSVNDNRIMPYFKKRYELSVEGNVILWGNRVVVPEALRSEILQELHSTHQGVTGMKGMARSLFWWPHLDSDIENLVKSCNICIQNANMPPKSLQPWPAANRVWSRIHVDYLGPVDNNMILVIQDAHSKWIEAFAVKNATAKVTLEKLYEIFARFGLPECIVSDNGSVFRSEEFDSFTKHNGIRHLFSAPYHPASNGQAERAVQFIKHRLRKVMGESLSVRLSRILMNFRRTPLALLGISPAEIMLGRQIRCRLDSVHSHPPESNYPSGRSFGNRGSIYFRNYGQGDKWVPGTILGPMGDKMYRVVHPNGSVAERHVDQLKPRLELPIPEQDQSQPLPESDNQKLSLDMPCVPGDKCISSSQSETTAAATLTDNNEGDKTFCSQRPSRTIRPPAKYKDYVS